MDQSTNSQPSTLKELIEQIQNQIIKEKITEDFKDEIIKLIM
jgi:hypothetical protein